MTRKSCNLQFFYLLAPIAPVVGNVTDVTVSESIAGIYLWPVEQRNGPIRWLFECVVQQREVYTFHCTAATHCIAWSIEYMKKFLDSDWLRAVQFQCNTSAKSVTPMQKV